jgi:hypothetical protein
MPACSAFLERLNMIILSCWMVLTAFFVALCMASGRREKEESQALVNMNRNAVEPEFIGTDAAPERNIASLSFNLKSS